MAVAYWVVVALLAVVYLYSGGKKVAQSRDRLRPMMAWVDDLPLGLIRTIGALELLGVVGLVVPPLTGVAPWLALVAAVGLVALQVGATTLHLASGGRGDLAQRRPARAGRARGLAGDGLALTVATNGVAARPTSSWSWVLPGRTLEA
ncbi:DoxX family protein [Isoptericola sp. NPDC057559]|uniref:DoxX family protein n=1 Tax=Isoptericola sp. NPDC057559 TaxID=3346168 RepID=UPI0036A0EE2B